LYPIEKEYLTPTWDEKFLGIPILKNFVTGISSKRIEFIQSNNYKYFNDLECEYEYLKTSQNFKGKKDVSFTIAKNKSEIDLSSDKKITVILTIEGTNNFYPTKNVNKADIGAVLSNIEKVKQWEHPVLWVTMAHHFYNGFVSHEKSLISEVLLLGDIDQSEGMNQPLSSITNYTYFTEEGLKVIDALLSTSNGRRILIDIKHVDYRGRKQYFQHIKTNYGNQIPVIISHAAVGNTDASEPPVFNTWTINLNNDDIYAVCETKGIIGIELDQRILGFDELKKYKKGKHEHFNSLGKKFSLEMIWNNIRYIAEKASEIKTYNPTFDLSEPWDIIAIGSDFDGVINPANQFPTLVQMPELREGLTEHIKDYITSTACSSNLKSQTTSTPEQIAEKIFFGNAYRFLQLNL
jgi:microsomal dipeptidase-like Zn-dependent dipeptidase